jgi:hypothetical protein
MPHLRKDPVLPTLRRLRAGPAWLAALLLLAACAGSAGGAGSAGAGDRPGHELTVELDRGDGTAAETYTLTCADDGGAGGDHPDAAAACALLLGAEDPFAPLPSDLACTEQYGGPQTARVRGIWRGEPVDLELSRVDGCRIAQWDALEPLLPGPVGVELPD